MEQSLSAHDCPPNCSSRILFHTFFSSFSCSLYPLYTFCQQVPKSAECTSRAEQLPQNQQHLGSPICPQTKTSPLSGNVLLLKLEPQHQHFISMYEDIKSDAAMIELLAVASVDLQSTPQQTHGIRIPDSLLTNQSSSLSAGNQVVGHASETQNGAELEKTFKYKSRIMNWFARNHGQLLAAANSAQEFQQSTGSKLMRSLLHITRKLIPKNCVSESILRNLRIEL